MDSNFKRLHEYLHRGGNYYYLWTDHNKLSVWSEVGKEIAIPKGHINVYFGVHPSHILKAEKERTKITDIQAINGLFAEFDIKSFKSKDDTLSHIRSLEIKPSVVIFSGGGYHCYYLLKEPFAIIDTETLERAKQAQYGWVAYSGGDKGAKDLARVLRVCGTKNVKPQYAPDYPEVKMVFSDWTRQYGLDQLEKYVPKVRKPEVRKPEVKLGKKYVEVAVKNEVDKVMYATDGNRNSQLNSSAFAIGRIVATGGMARSAAEGYLLGAALVAGLPEREAERTIKSGLESGLSK